MHNFILFLVLVFFSSSAATNEHKFKDSVFKVSTYLTELGEKNEESILLIHGLSHEAVKNWGKLPDELAKKYHVLKVELPGFGRSERSKEELYTPANYARYLDEIVRKFAHNSKVIVIGHSLGGAISLSYVSMFQKHVEKLVLISAAGILQRSVFIRNLTELEKKKDDSFLAGVYNKTAGLINGMAGAVFDFGDRFSKIQDFLMNSGELRTFLVKDKTVVRAAIALIETNYGRIFSSIKVPTLLLWGDKDKIAPLRSAKILDNQIQNSNLTVFGGVGHNPMTDVASKVSKNILSWLRSPVSKPVAEVHTDSIKFKRPYSCKGKDGIKLSGNFEEIRLRGCRNIQLTDVVTKKIRMRDSSVHAENLRIEGKDFAIEMKESTLTATNMVISSKYVFKLNASKLDIAAVQIDYKEKLVIANNKSTIWWSVSESTREHSDTEYHHYTRSYR